MSARAKLEGIVLLLRSGAQGQEGDFGRAIQSNRQAHRSQAGVGVEGKRTYLRNPHTYFLAILGR